MLNIYLDTVNNKVVISVTMKCEDMEGFIIYWVDRSFYVKDGYNYSW